MTNENEDGSPEVEEEASMAEASAASAELLAAPPPETVADLAHACIRFVERASGVKLDFSPETLPLLDHYLEEARSVLSQPKAEGSAQESFDLISRAAGAYFGEVVRRRYPSWWRLGAAETDEHRLEFHRVYLVIHPVLLMADALVLDPKKQGSDLQGFDLDPEDAEAAAKRLADLPEVELEEFVKPSTRLEVLDIVMDAVRTAHAADGAEPLELSGEDYVH